MFGGDSELEFWDRETHERILLGDDMLIFRNMEGTSGWPQFGDAHPDKRWKPSLSHRAYPYRTSRNWWYFNQKGIEGFLVKTIGEIWGMDLDATLDCTTVYYSVEDTVEVRLADVDDAASFIVAEWRVGKPS